MRCMARVCVCAAVVMDMSDPSQTRPAGVPGKYGASCVGGSAATTLGKWATCRLPRSRAPKGKQQLKYVLMACLEAKESEWWLFEGHHKLPESDMGKAKVQTSIPRKTRKVCFAAPVVAIKTHTFSWCRCSTHNVVWRLGCQTYLHWTEGWHGLYHCSHRAKIRIFVFWHIVPYVARMALTGLVEWLLFISLRYEKSWGDRPEHESREPKKEFRKRRVAQVG